MEMATRTSQDQGRSRANKDVKMFMACQGLLLSPASQVCKQAVSFQKKTKKKQKGESSRSWFFRLSTLSPSCNCRVREMTGGIGLEGPV